MLSEQNTEGIAALEKAMELDAEYTSPSCELICGYYLQQGQEKEAQKYYDKAVSVARRRR